MSVHSDTGESSLIKASGCISLDLEVTKNGRIRAFGAIRADTQISLTHSGAGMKAALAELDELADGADCLLGHNIIKFDIRYLQAAKPGLRLLKLPVIDTLRLSPLAFPRHPYHHLVKHYQDGGIKRGRINDPELDARLALEVFDDQCKALCKAQPALLAAWHRLATPQPDGVDRALDDLFSKLRGFGRPSNLEAREAILEVFDARVCSARGRAIAERCREGGWPLAYALAWLSVSGDDMKSAMPPWVRHQFPEAGQLVRELRNQACSDSGCSWCSQRHNASKELKRWLGFDHFRPNPELPDGGSMQQAIVEHAMAGNHVLGIMPTGSGKSLCYQVPALSRYYKTGALTIVISPLVALMADQVAGMKAAGIECCGTINGLMSMPERSDMLDQVRMGETGILLIAPEQLRSQALRRVIRQREIGGWVLDEAHCLSRWGHDFRPDYRYVGRFIKKKADAGEMPCIMCLTATAKPEVVDDVSRYFSKNLEIDLQIFNGGADRGNLQFEIHETSEKHKFHDTLNLLVQYLPDDGLGGAIVYCATRQQSEDIAQFLSVNGIDANHFHAGLQPEAKKDVLQQFVDGSLRAIAATNAFGMGIDKPDVRLVVHADIPGSLENYLQEAGRAGRDNGPAFCVLLYDCNDVERQFGLCAMSRLTQAEIHGILRAIRNLNRKDRFKGEVVATAGEILLEDQENAFSRDSTSDDSRVRTAVAWLEESRLLERNENIVRIFPSSLRVASVEEAEHRLAKARITNDYREKLVCIARAMIEASPDEGLSTDQLMGVSGLGPDAVRAALYDLEHFGIASNDMSLTAFVHKGKGVRKPSKKRFKEACDLEVALIGHLREEAPDMVQGDTAPLHLRMASQKLRNDGLADPLPEKIWRIIRGISQDGRGGDDNIGGSISARKFDMETASITLNRDWQTLDRLAKVRRQAAKCLLDHLLGKLPPKSHGNDLLTETTLGDLLGAIKSGVLSNNATRNPQKLLDRALLWLHEQEVITLNKGLAVLRPAMLIRLERKESRGFSKADFEPLAMHYKDRAIQIHVMKEFAEQGISDSRAALRMAMDYFRMNQEEFLAKWMPGRKAELERETTPESWYAIVESLNNPVQQRIVADQRKETNVLVLAGPGSGKTRVLVHRIAYLVRAKRQKARGILALVYNRHAAVEIRRRLNNLIGDDARGVTVMTCHALAMRLVGVSFSGSTGPLDDGKFQDVLTDATSLLRGDDMPSEEEADEQRARLLAGFRWILVDEYQDIGPLEYGLVSALAGRTRKDEDGKLNLFAVGDDDQNIYSFKGASVKFIRQFESDYGAKPAYLVENYRSSFHIITTANALIAPAKDRLKIKHPIEIDFVRKMNLPGGEWERLDSVSRGLVQILAAGRSAASQAQVAIGEMKRLSTLSPDWDWSRCAIIARQWRYLDPVYALCELEGIPVQLANEESTNFWRLRETQALVSWVRQREERIIDTLKLNAWLQQRRPLNCWNELLQQAIQEYGLEINEANMPADHFVEWLAEWSRGYRRRQQGVLLLTAHAAKGLEFDHVIVLDGGWDRSGSGEDADASRRLYYVAMTRPRLTLALAKLDRQNRFVNCLGQISSVWNREPVDFPDQSSLLDKRHIQLSLEQVDVGYAGRRGRRSNVHQAIKALSVQDPLTVEICNGYWNLLDVYGTTVGRTARKFEPPAGMRLYSAQVAAVADWSAEASSPEYRKGLECDTWEVVVPQFVFEPN